MITILVLIGFFLVLLGSIYLLGRLADWLTEKGESYPPEAAEAPCPMCDKPVIPPDHDCAAGLAKALLTPDCPSIIAGSDIDASQWAGIVQQLPELAEIDAKRLEDLYLIPEQP